MPQHLSQDQIEEFRNGTLPPGKLLELDDHLSECGVCSGMATGPKLYGVLSLCESLLGNDEHLTYDQLAFYVDGQLDSIASEVVDLHVEGCRGCSDQLSDLRRVKEELATSVPLPVALSVPLVEQFKRTAAGWFGSIGRIAVVAGIVLALATWLLWFTAKETRRDRADAPPATHNGDAGSEDLPFSVPVADPDAKTNGKEAHPQTVARVIDASSQIELDETGKVSGIDDPRYEQKIRDALTTQTIEISPVTRELRSSPGRLMGGTGTAPFRLDDPVGKVVPSDRPVFAWERLAGAQSYVVEVYDENFNKVLSSTSLSGTRWASSAPLRRGRLYKWQVTAFKDGEEVRAPVRPAPDAKFKVLDAVRAGELDRVRTRHRKSYLILGIAYAEAGLLDEAEHAFQALAQKNPNSAIPRKLLAKVKAAR
ncbi:MAG TPA: tetratricopeptide repeat protein [Pyrinomonadaceae bacterium]|nr:tetratricopeptide repeat protein [Pyrinomonadaceae bacterium]